MANLAEFDYIVVVDSGMLVDKLQTELSIYPSVIRDVTLGM